MVLAAVTPMARALGATVALLRLWRLCRSLGVSHTLARSHCTLAAILATTEGSWASFTGWCALVGIHRHTLAMQCNTAVADHKHAIDPIEKGLAELFLGLLVGHLTWDLRIVGIQ